MKEALLLTLLAVAAPQTETADPFYADLLATGKSHYYAGEYREASETLEIACFGLLDTPIQLVDCRAHRALSLHASGDSKGTVDVIEKLAELEARFGAFSRAPLLAATRAAIGQRVLELTDVEAIPTVSRVRPLLEAVLRDELSSIAAENRRDRIQRALDQRPDHPVWLTLLGELQIDEGDYPAAVTTATTLLDQAPVDDGALCLRARALAAQGQCELARSDFNRCERGGSDLAVSSALATCRPAAGPTSHQLADEPVPSSSAPATTPVRPAESQGSVASPPRREAPVSRPNEEGRRAILSARDLLLQATSKSDLERAFALAKPVADRYPGASDAQHLVGQIAYRAQRWPTATYYFQRGGDPGDESAELLFYMSVAYFESGYKNLAASTLKRCLDELEPSEFVTRYATRILATDPG